jgi:hypothetical protein
LKPMHTFNVLLGNICKPKMLYVMSVTSYNGYLTHNKRYTLPGVHIRLNTTPETNRLLEKS